MPIIIANEPADFSIHHLDTVKRGKVLAMGSKGRWNPPEDTRPSFKGRNVIVTGSNSGVGFEAALKFVQLNADLVILAVRSIKKGGAAKAQIEAATGRQGCVQVWQLDMMSYDSITAFATRASQDLKHLDIAVLNAGIQPSQHALSPYGWETALQCNTLSTMLLSLLLLPKLQSSKTDSYTPVLELVSSSNHYMVSKVDSDPSSKQSLLEYNNNFSSFQGYGLSKLFLMYGLAGLVQQESKGAKGPPKVFITSVCPGGTQSGIMRSYPWYTKPFFWVINHFVNKTTEQGARTYISGVTTGQEGHGRFWRDDVIEEPAPMLKGEQGAKLQKQVWAEMVDALKKDVPEVQHLVKA
ncbi:short chain dehydrogenase [Phlyctema vagabunda]|uniref:Short chain dehydrogenase n=1 Tax=Phlyctema vagabunda TaxID=108571 RepID=A0ABR4PT26_9HELO